MMGLLDDYNDDRDMAAYYASQKIKVAKRAMKTYCLDKQFIELEMLHLDCQRAQVSRSPRKGVNSAGYLHLAVKKQNTLLPV